MRSTKDFVNYPGLVGLIMHVLGKMDYECPVECLIKSPFISGQRFLPFFSKATPESLELIESSEQLRDLIKSCNRRHIIYALQHIFQSDTEVLRANLENGRLDAELKLCADAVKQHIDETPTLRSKYGSSFVMGSHEFSRAGMICSYARDSKTIDYFYTSPGWQNVLKDLPPAAAQKLKYTVFVYPVELLELALGSNEMAKLMNIKDSKPDLFAYNVFDVIAAAKKKPEGIIIMQNYVRDKGGDGLALA